VPAASPQNSKSNRSNLSEAERKIYEEYELLAQALTSRQPLNDGSFSNFDDFMDFCLSTPTDKDSLKSFLKDGWVNPVRNDYAHRANVKKKPKKHRKS
jgi:hypothetical protein